MEIRINPRFAIVFVIICAVVLLAYRGCTYMELTKEIQLRKEHIANGRDHANRQIDRAKGKSKWKKKARKKK